MNKNLSDLQPPDGSVRIANISIDLYRAPDGTIHWFDDTEVRVEDEDAEDLDAQMNSENANIYRALIEAAESYKPTQGAGQ